MKDRLCTAPLGLVTAPLGLGTAAMPLLHHLNPIHIDNETLTHTNQHLYLK